MGNWDLGLLFCLSCLQFTRSLSLLFWNVDFFSNSTSLHSGAFITPIEEGFFCFILRSVVSPFGIWMLVLLSWLVFFRDLRQFIAFTSLLAQNFKILFSGFFKRNSQTVFPCFYVKFGITVSFKQKKNILC